MMPPYLRTTFFYTAGAIALVVFVLVIYALLTFKRNDKDSAKDPNLKVELLWTLVPFLMLLIMSLPVIKAFYARQASPVPVSTLGVSHEK